jgi:hypothetical protein
MNRHASSHPTGDASGPPAPDRAFDPSAEAPASELSGELFVHGLLLQRALDTVQAQEARVRRVMDAIARGVEAPAPPLPLRIPQPTARASASNNTPTRAHFAPRDPWRLVRSWSAAAALLALGSLVAVVAMPAPSAQAMVQASINAMRAAGAARYEVRVPEVFVGEAPNGPVGAIDTLAPNKILIRTFGPQGRGIVAGHDGDGAWAIRPDGVVDRDNPQRAWPRWANFAGEGLFADSVDRMIENLGQGYTITREADATLEDREGAFERVIARKRVLAGPGAHQVHLWIDPATKLVERLEMIWEHPPPQRRPGPGGPGGPGGPSGLGRHEGPPSPMPPWLRLPPHPDHARPNHAPPDHAGPDHARPDHARPDHARPDHARPDHARPDKPPHNRPLGPFPRESRDRAMDELPREQSLDAPQAGELEPRDQSRDEPAQPEPAPSDRAQDKHAPDARGPGPRRPGPHTPFEHRGPSEHRGPPGMRPNPPKRLVIDRVEAPDFAPDWFTPEAHAR